MRNLVANKSVNGIGLLAALLFLVGTILFATQPVAAQPVSCDANNEIIVDKSVIPSNICNEFNKFLYEIFTGCS